jgi:beta-ribofuranosylaminobenzene 5'-phosphate synthase
LRASTRVREELGEGWSVVVTRGRNRGAEVEVS